MANLDQLIEQMRNNPKNIRYVDLLKVCKQFLVNQDKQVVVRLYLKHRGKAILVLIFKMIAERLNLIRLGKY